MHIIIPAAGRMRLKTSQSGIWRTKRSSALRVNRLTRMLVPKPKKAFQSPGTQSNGLPVKDGSEDFEPAVVVMALAPSRSRALGRERLQDSRRVGDPSEDSPLGLDHPKADLMELGEVRSTAVARHQALVAAVVG